MITRIAILAALAVLGPPAAVAGQEPPPTVDDVLRRLAAGGSGEELRWVESDAVKLLRQVYGPMRQAEIERFVDALADLALNGGAEGRNALLGAVVRPGSYLDGLGYLDADDIHDGRPVPEAFDALVRIYETHAADALAGGGDDPFLEAARHDMDHAIRLGSHLRDVFIADLAPDGRGWRYVLALFERSNPPCKSGSMVQTDQGWTTISDLVPNCTTGRGSAWCAAGSLLHGGLLGWTRPWPGPDPDRYRRLCKGRRPWNWMELPPGG